MVHIKAEAFRGATAAYESGRPGYPPEVLDDLPPGRVLDLAAGTGKFTRLLVAGGRSVIAVEPLVEMAQRIRNTLPGVRVLSGTAEAIPLADGAVDLVCCAQAFHWFDCAAATREIHRVLAPGGHLALIWNLRDSNVSWMRRLNAIWSDHAGATPRHAGGAWQAILSDPRFAVVRETRHPFADPMTPDRLVDRMLSTSFIAALPRREQDEIRAEVRDILDDEPELAGEATFDFPYNCEVTLLRRQEGLDGKLVPQGPGVR